MARKKIVFVVVEGPSDDEALGVLEIYYRGGAFFGKAYQLGDLFSGE